MLGENLREKYMGSRGHLVESVDYLKHKAGKKKNTYSDYAIMPKLWDCHGIGNRIHQLDQILSQKNEVKKTCECARTNFKLQPFRDHNLSSFF